MIPNTLGTYRRFSFNKTEADIVQWDYGSWPSGLPKKDGANALSGAGSLDTATTRPSKTSRTKNLIIEHKCEFIEQLLFTARELEERAPLHLVTQFLDDFGFLPCHQ